MKKQKLEKTNSKTHVIKINSYTNKYTIASWANLILSCFKQLPKNLHLFYCQCNVSDNPLIHAETRTWHNNNI